jgi:hypothetical protein
VSSPVINSRNPSFQNAPTPSSPPETDSPRKSQNSCRVSPAFGDFLAGRQHSDFRPQCPSGRSA